MCGGIGLQLGGDAAVVLIAFLAAVAIDLCPTDTRGGPWDWLVENGGVYGWENPAWAQSGGSGPFEPWHWEFTRGVMESGEYYSS